MSSSISSSLSTTAPTAAKSSSNSAATQKTRQTTNGSADTVKLSESQQVHQLYEQGQKVPQIASSLNLTVDTVNTYLGISKATS